MFGFLEKEIKRIEEEKNKNVVTITEAEFVRVSAEIVPETMLVDGLVRENPMMLIALAEYTGAIAKALFHKDENKDKEDK